ncbi:MAG: hypothetical protein GY719_19095 [bacterium]|nr:hypothetical protein [bacterium]
MSGKEAAERKNTDRPQSPYRGLHAFRYSDRHVFLGRDKIAENLFAKVLVSPLVVLFGHSGSGKSSLINAGLVPALRKESYGVERLLLRPIRDEPILVERIDTGEEPGPGFTPSIFDTKTQSQGSRIAISLEHFREILSLRDSPSPCVLIFDQFEELFTLFDRESEEQQILRREFLEMFFKVANSDDFHIKILIAIREDFLGRLELLTKNYARIFDYRLRLGHLSREDARKAILDPFKPGHSYVSRIKPELAQEILSDLKEHRLEGSIHPTKLQIVCNRLWNRFAADRVEIGIDEYKELDRVRGILQTLLEDELDIRPGKRRTLTIATLGQLITDQSTRDVVSEGKLLELITSAEGADPKKVDPILRYLKTKKLVSLTAQRGTSYYELTTEYLIPSIEQEVRDRESREAYRLEVAKPIEEKVAQIKRAKRRAKRLRRFLGYPVVLLLATLSFVAFFFKTRDKTQELESLIRKHAESAEQHKLEARSNHQIFQETEDDLNSQIATLEKERQGRDILFQKIFQGIDESVTELTRAKKKREQAEEQKALEEKKKRLSDSVEELRRELSRHERRKERRRRSEEAARRLLWRTDQLGDYNRLDRLLLALHTASITSGADEATPIDAKRAVRKTLEDAFTLQAPSEVRDLSITSKKRLLAAATASGVFLWDFQGRAKEPLRQGEAFSSVAFNGDTGNRLVASSEGQSAIIWDVETWSEIARFDTNLFPINSIALNPDGSQLATGSKLLTLWNVHDRTFDRMNINSAFKFSNKILAVDFSDSGNLIATGNHNDRAVVWYLEERERTTLRHESPVEAVDLDHTGRYLATGSSDRIEVWDLTTHKSIGHQPLDGSSEPVTDVAFSQDGALLAASGGQSVKVWAFQAGIQPEPLVELHAFQAHDGTVHTVAFRPGETGRQFLFSGGTDSKIRIYLLESHADLDGHWEELLAIARRKVGQHRLSDERCRNFFREDCPALPER